MIIFTSELGNSLHFFILHKQLTIIICTERFNTLRSPLKIFMRMQNRIASFFIHIILLYLFCPAAGAHQQARLIWLPSAPFRGVACPLPSLLSHQSVAAPQIVSPGAPWVVGDEEEGGSDMSAALNCYRSSYLNPPPRFLRVRLRVQEDFKVVGRGGAESVRLSLFRAAFVAIYPSIIFSPSHLVGNGEKKTTKWNIETSLEFLPSVNRLSSRRVVASDTFFTPLKERRGKGMEVCADRRTVPLAVAMQTEEEDTVHWSVYPLVHLRHRKKEKKEKKETC